MKRNFLLETTILSVVCVNVNNALCDCCIVGKEKKFIADALGIKKGDIGFIKIIKGKYTEDEIRAFGDKQGEDFKEKVKNSHCAVLVVINVDDSGEPKEDDCYAVYALINKEKNINPSSKLLDKVVSKNKFLSENIGKKFKFIVVKKCGESTETLYSCKKN